MWFVSTSDKVKGKEAEGRSLAEVYVRQSTSGRGDTTAPEILGQETCNSGGVGGPMDHF